MWWKQGDGAGSGSHPTQRDWIKIHSVHCCCPPTPTPHRPSPFPVNISKQVRAGPSPFCISRITLYEITPTNIQWFSMLTTPPADNFPVCLCVHFFSFPFLHPLSNSISLSFPREPRRQGPVKMQRDWQQQNSINSSTALAFGPV